MKIIYPLITMLVIAGCLLMGCNPTVKVEAPDKPIVVNLNVKIDHTLYVQIQKEVAETIAKNPDIF